MFLLRYISSLTLCLVLLAHRTVPTPTSGLGKREKLKWVVLKTSTLSIAGHTNINKFSCGVNEYTGPDTVLSTNGFSYEDPQGIPLRGVLRINIGDFDCRNGMMTTEFKNTLRYKEFPHLTITFLSLDRIPSFNVKADSVKGWVEVALAGVCRRFQICYVSYTGNGKDAELIGCRAFAFSDFQLKAPRKMGGLVRVADQLEVQFHLYLKQVG